MATTRQDRKKAVKRTLANSDRYIAGEISLGSALEITTAQYQQVPDPARKTSE